MSAVPPQNSPLLVRRLVLLVVALIGLVITMGLYGELCRRAEQQLQQRFEEVARQHGERMVGDFAAVLEEFSVLQRFFYSVGDVGWPLFKKFVDPMIGRKAIRGIGWAPLIDGAQRAEFEAMGQSLWSADFAIREVNEKGIHLPAASRERSLPVLYTLGEFAPRLLGLDLLAPERLRSLVDRAAEKNQLTAGEITDFFDLADVPASSPLAQAANEAHLMLFLLPVYRAGVPVDSADPVERKASLRGVLFVALDIGRHVEQVNDAAALAGLRISLDAARGLPIGRGQAAGYAEAGDSSELAGRLIYSHDLTLAGRPLVYHVEAGPDWINANSTPTEPYVLVVGMSLTLLLLFALNKLLARSAWTHLLARNHEVDGAQPWNTENWLGKLSRVVEQNPASIVITDLHGVIEYVNDQFLKTTGYTRDESLGQDIRMLRPEVVDGPHYLQMTQALLAGESWLGELQSKRRDGSHLWERVLISPIRNHAGEITNYVSTRENINELRLIMTRLMDSEERFRGAVSVMVEGLIIFSAAGRFLFANRAAEDFLGVSAHALIGQLPGVVALQRLREDGTPCPFDEYPSTIALREGREVHDAVMGYSSADGAVRWVEINASPLRASGGEVSGAVLTFSEITARRRTEEQLKLAFEAIRCSGEGILVTDAHRIILSANPAFEAVTGYRADEVIGKTPAVFSSPRQDEDFYDQMHRALESTGYWRGEIWNQRRSGEVYPEWLGISLVRDDHGRVKYYVYIFSDMTERKAAQQRIEFLAHHDSLTGLPNRLLLRDRVDQAKTLALRGSSRFALLFLDLDRFKTINDSLGHPVGDTLLMDVVERLKACVRESDTISRQGGDEFVVLLNDVRDSESVARIADKIHQRMAEPFMLGGHALNTSFSIGIALYPDDGNDFDSLLQKADTAMYHAKESGRNAHRFFTEQMNQQVVEHLTLETQLRKAIENKEFVLHYQPQMDLRDGTIVGVEALIRWDSPENGLVSPARFIPVAEVSGLIVPIGAWVIHEACRQARAWQEAGLPPFVVAVNLSAVQFKRLDLINTVINALVLSDLDSQWLELELTESILLQDTESTLDVVRRLKALGVKLSVDDFGTGYSSLAYLKRFAVDKLKIDQSFIRDLVSDPDDAAIVRAIIQMAHSMKLKTIAEGVENDELTNLLRIFNCDEIQGYGFARPMPAEQLSAFVRQHQARLTSTAT